MNQVTIIGNLTSDPELRSTPSGVSVCTFTVAVNRQKDGADFFRVSAWRILGENCKKYLGKGRKVAVTGTVSARAYNNKSGEAQASLEVTADKVEFLTKPDAKLEDVPSDGNPFADITAEDCPF